MSGRSVVSDAAVLAAVPEAANLRQLLQSLGMAPYGGNYEVVRERLVALGVHDERFRRRPRRPLPPVDPADLRRAVGVAVSFAQVARAVGLGEGSHAQRRAKELVLAAGLDTAHFLGRASRRSTAGGRPAEDWSSVLVAGRRRHTSSLRRRLLAEGLLEAECDGCRLREWQGRPIALELDHVNGDRTDNRLDNLRLLCPNCHAQTDTYRGRNIGAAPAEEPAAAPVQPRSAAATRRLARVLPAGPSLSLAPP